MAYNKIGENEDVFSAGEIIKQRVTEERWRIWAEVCKHIPKGTEQSDLIHKIIFSA